jgi:tetratricopeptide (TPR) repeat protein
MGNKTEAESLLRSAARSDPDQPEYTTLLAWVQAENRGPPPDMSEGQRTNFYRDELAMLDRVIDNEPDYERARFYRGMLRKRSGMPDKALSDFRKAAQLNPRNVDAKRELRLHDMRKKKDSKGGLFGKLFGSDD